MQQAKAVAGIGRELWTDPSWLAALLVAPILWLLILMTTGSTIHLDWFLQAPLLFLLLVIVYPILEEVVFRGMFQGWLMSKEKTSFSCYGLSTANIITSLLFAALHSQSHPVLMAALIFFPSILFGYFRDRYHGNLWPSIILHAYYNAGYFFLYPPTIL